MKNFLFIYLFITLSIIVNSCDEGYKDENTITSFSIALKEVTAVPSTTTDATPDYTFSSNIAGYITHGGSCSSSTTVASQGNNKITLNSLINGTLVLLHTEDHVLQVQQLQAKEIIKLL